MSGKLWTLVGVIVIGLGIWVTGARGGAGDGYIRASAAGSGGPSPVAQPDTTGAAMWAHMQEADYRENWELWPGLGEFYQGNEPHGMLLTTYVNDVAKRALDAGSVLMPEGAVVIKENYMPNRDLAAITVMYKRSGYNAEHNDWFFTKFLPDGSLDTMPNGMAMEGRLPGCQNCHMGRQSFDYLYSPRAN